jgi:flagellar biosynthesis protein FlhA
LQAAWIKAVRKSASTVRSSGYQSVVILCTEEARYLVKNSSEREIPELAVISVKEITPDVIPEAVGIIRLEAPPKKSAPLKEGASSKEGSPSREGGE